MKHKKYLLLLLAFIFLNGCCQAPSGEKMSDAYVTINNYSISRDEFEKEFKESTYGNIDTPQSRKDFLESLINRKLILQYAQNEGLDKEKGFLKMIEKFWEQSLLKVALEKKTDEISGQYTVTDDEVKKVYDDMLKEGKAEGPYETVSERIKWQIVRSKENKLMNDWIAQMREKAKITIKGGAENGTSR